MIDDDRLPWFHCYPSKLLGAMAGMKPDQQLVYVVVLLRIYEVRGPCPDTLDALSRRVGFNKRRVTEALDALYRAGKLATVSGGITNPFSEKVLATGAAKHEKRVRAGGEGGKSAAKNRLKKQDPPPTNATAKPYQEDLDLEKEKEVPTVPNGTVAPEAAREGGDSSSTVDPEVMLFRRGKEVLGRNAGGMIRNLLAAKDGDVTAARNAIEESATKESPREYIGRALRPRRAATKNGHAALLLNSMETRRDEPPHHGRTIEHEPRPHRSRD